MVEANRPVPNEHEDAGRTLVDVLLIDDDQIMAELLGLWLESNGHACHRAFDTDSALKAMVEHPSIGLVVCDFELGQVRGGEVVERLREDRPDLPAILISGHAESYIRSITGDLDVGFLQKPFDPGSLVTAISALS